MTAKEKEETKQSVTFQLRLLKYVYVRTHFHVHAKKATSTLYLEPNQRQVSSE